MKSLKILLGVTGGISAYKSPDLVRRLRERGAEVQVVMTAGAIITGLTVLSSFTAVRVYLSEQFPTALRGRGHFFGEATGRLFSGVLTPFLLEPHTGSPTIFFGTIMVVVAVGACVPLLVGKETVGQLELVTEASEEPAF